MKLVIHSEVCTIQLPVMCNSGSVKKRRSDYQKKTKTTQCATPHLRRCAETRMKISLHQEGASQVLVLKKNESLNEKKKSRPFGTPKKSLRRRTKPRHRPENFLGHRKSGENHAVCLPRKTKKWQFFR